MAENWPNLMEVSFERSGKDGKPYRVANLLSKSSELINYIPMLPANNGNSHNGLVTTALPTVELKRHYKGIMPSKDGDALVEDNCCMIAGRAEIDVDIANMYDDPKTYRGKRAMRFIEALHQKWASQMMYGDGQGDSMVGLISRMNSKTDENSDYIIDCGGTGSDNCSMVLCVWGEDTGHGIYPEKSPAGLRHEDIGPVDVRESDGRVNRVYAEEWKWQFGLHILDYRYFPRICNIDVSDLRALTGTQAITASTNIIDAAGEAVQMIPSAGMGKACFIAPRLVKRKLSTMAAKMSSNVLAVTPGLNQFGKFAPGSVAGNQGDFTGSSLILHGVPVLTEDAMLITEERVV